MKPSVPNSVDEYLAAQPEAVRQKLEQVRAAIRRAVPEAVEGIGYRMPGYKLRGKGCELRKGTVHFPLTEPVRAAGIAATGQREGRSKVGKVGSRSARLRDACLLAQSPADALFQTGSDAKG